MVNTFFVAIVSQTDPPVGIIPVPLPERGAPEGAMALAATPTPRRKRLDNIEVNYLINKYLGLHPRASIREVVQGVGLSVGKVAQTDAWRQEMGKRKAAREPSKKPHRQLTDKMLACIGRDDDIAGRLDAQDAVWQRLLDKAHPNDRAKLHAMTKDERKRLIEATGAQMLDERAEQDE